MQVNSCKIEFYWSIGRDICEMNVEQRYGDGVIKTLSQDLRMKIPEVKGLTPGGLYYCKRFYLLYNKVFEIFPQLGEISVPQLGEMLTPLHSVSTDTNIQPLNIFAIPWGHHKVLIDNFESEPQKALFYAAKTLQNGWSRAVLENMIGDKGKNNGLYERQGNAVNNFPATLMPLGMLCAEWLAKHQFRNNVEDGDTILPLQRANASTSLYHRCLDAVDYFGNNPRCNMPDYRQFVSACMEHRLHCCSGW